MDVSSLSGRFVEPHKVVNHFHIRPGDRVADFGAGSGYFTKVLAEAVGPEGRVYACEIQKQLVEAIGELVRREHLENVQILWSDLEASGGTKIEAATLDVGILVNTLFQVEDKAAAIREVSRTLRPGGKFFVIDWNESWGGLGPRPQEVVTATDARALIEPHGFVLEREFDAGDHHYGLAFKKA